MHGDCQPEWWLGAGRCIDAIPCYNLTKLIKMCPTHKAISPNKWVFQVQVCVGFQEVVRVTKRNYSFRSAISGSWYVLWALVLIILSNSTGQDGDFNLANTMVYHCQTTLWSCQHSYWKWPSIVDLPIKIVIFHSYVSLPVGNSWSLICNPEEICFSETG